MRFLRSGLSVTSVACAAACGSFAPSGENVDAGFDAGFDAGAEAADASASSDADAGAIGTSDPGVVECDLSSLQTEEKRCNTSKGEACCYVRLSNAYRSEKADTDRCQASAGCLTAVVAFARPST